MKKHVNWPRWNQNKKAINHFWQQQSTWVIVVVFCVQWLILSTINHPSWDGAYYYSYARSFVYDGDLHLANDLQLSYPAASDFSLKNNHLKLTSTGHIENFFAPGTAVQWLPWLVVTRPFFDTGYEPVVQQTAAAITMLLGLWGYWLMCQLSRRFAPTTTMLATVTIMGCTPLLFYQFRDPFYAHVPSAVVATIIIGYWLHIEKKGALYQWFALGLLLGFGTLIRWQSVVYGILPAFTLVWHSWKRKTIGRTMIEGLCVTAGALLIIMPQLGLWKLYYGSWVTIPQGNSFINWRASWWQPLLFSPFRGIIAWFPLFLPSIAGLFILLKNHSRVVIPMLLVIVLQLYVNSSTRDWFGGGGFGLRRFSSEIPILLIGYAVLLTRLPVIMRYLLTMGLIWQQWGLLRYGLTEKLGGRVVSMSPDFRYIEQSWVTFLSELTTYMSYALTQPYEFWIIDGSPITILLHGEWPILHISTLIIAAVFLTISGLLMLTATRTAAAWYFWRRNP